MHSAVLVERIRKSRKKIKTHSFPKWIQRGSRDAFFFLQHSLPLELFSSSTIGYKNNMKTPSCKNSRGSRARIVCPARGENVFPFSLRRVAKPVVLRLPLFGRSQHDGAPLTVVHGHRARVVQHVDVRVQAVAHDELLAADRAGWLIRRTAVQVFQHVVCGVQVFAFYPAAHAWKKSPLSYHCIYYL